MEGSANAGRPSKPHVVIADPLKLMSGADLPEPKVGDSVEAFDN
jgi:hypothetical protein